MPSHAKIKRIIYTLKRKWGKPATIYRETVTTDIDTGANTATEVYSVTIRRAVLLPRNAKLDFAYDLSYIAANKNFTYGGFYGHNNQMILIDAVDLDGEEVQKDDYILIQDRRHVIKKLHRYDEGGELIAYILEATNVEAEATNVEAEEPR